jgi:hypothetical protein
MKEVKPGGPEPMIDRVRVETGRQQLRTGDDPVLLGGDSGDFSVPAERCGQLTWICTVK